MFRTPVMRKLQASLIATVMLASTTLTPALACTRTLFVGDDNMVATGRNMDWREDMLSNLWVLPAGIERDGLGGERSIKWKSKYGSVVTTGYEAGSTDGMNEKGLVANLLYLSQADYGDDTANPTITVGLWAQYVLDNYATVDEVVKGFEEHPLHIVAPALPNGSAATIHLSVSDPTGDSAIFEYLDGKLQVHHGKQYNIMTNSPPFDQQLALNGYWQNIKDTFLPGTNSAADRFVRASYLMDAVKKSTDPNFIKDVEGQSYARQAVAQTLSVMRSVSVPIGITTPGQPNIASTLWRTAADQKNMIYFFDSATMPNTFWVDLKKLNLAKGAPPKKLPVAGGHDYSGETSMHFIKAKPFTFMTAEPSSNAAPAAE